jgi:hypothetical protein
MSELIFCSVSPMDCWEIGGVGALVLHLPLRCRIRKGERGQSSFAIQDGVSRQVIAHENWIEPTSGAGEL